MEPENRLVIVDAVTAAVVAALEARIAALEREVALLRKKSLTPSEADELLGLPSKSGV